MPDVRTAAIIALIHVLPKGLHCIRHHGLLAKANRPANIAQAAGHELRSNEPKTLQVAATEDQRVVPRPCPCCGGRMIVIEPLRADASPSTGPPASHEIRIDTS
jgi:hypothetical protein